MPRFRAYFVLLIAILGLAIGQGRAAMNRVPSWRNFAYARFDPTRPVIVSLSNL